MIDERLKEWRRLATIDYVRSPIRKNGKLSAPTFSDKYFDLLSSITQLQDALNQACDVIEAKNVFDDLGGKKVLQQILDKLGVNK
jgi:hypothetical protein